jgi:hypothetical protein
MSEQGQDRRSRFQIRGVPINDLVSALAADHVVETPEERDQRRSDEATAELDRIVARREADDREREDAREASNNPEGGREAVRRLPLRRLI